MMRWTVAAWLSAARAHHGAAAANRLAVDLRLVLRHAGADQRADHAAGRRTGHGADRGRRQGAGRHDRTQARNGDDAVQPASRPAVPPRAAPTPAPGPAADGSWMRALSSQTYLLAIRLMSESADAGRLEVGHDLAGLAVGVIDTCDGLDDDVPSRR